MNRIHPTGTATTAALALDTTIPDPEPGATSVLHAARAALAQNIAASEFIVLAIVAAIPAIMATPPA